MDDFILWNLAIFFLVSSFCFVIYILIERKEVFEKIMKFIFEWGKVRKEAWDVFRR